MYINTTAVLKWGAIALLLGLAVYLGFRFLLPVLAPFIVAFLLARLIEPLVRSLCRRGIKREYASGFVTLLFVGALFGGIIAIIAKSANEVSEIGEELPHLLNSAADLVADTRHKVSDIMVEMPPELVGIVDNSMVSLSGFMSSLPARASEWLLGFFSVLAQETPGILLFTVTCLMCIYFISASFPDVQAFLDIHLSEKWQRRRRKIGEHMRFTVWKYIQAQAILTLITFAELLLAFWLLKIERAFMLAVVVALLDALPVFGAGLVLLPWSVFLLILGDIPTALGLLIAWLIITLLHNCLQAKLLGDKLGLHPLITLLSIYVGWSFSGVWGMILFPMVALGIKQFSGGKKLFKRSVSRTFFREQGT